jgi:hypothetical protein
MPTLDAPPSSSSRRRVTAYRVVTIAILVGMALLWAFVLTRPSSPPPDALDDVAFAVAAERTCGTTTAMLDQLPQAFESQSASDRADVVTQSNDELGAMLAALRTTMPPGERDQRMLTEWIGDWQVYLDNRTDYVDRLREDPDARLYVAEKDSRQITVAIDRFAEVNDMPACRTPKDIT